MAERDMLDLLNDRDAQLVQMRIEDRAQELALSRERADIAYWLEGLALDHRGAGDVLREAARRIRVGDYR